MKRLLFFSCFALLQKEHPQWIQHVVSAPPDLWLLLDIVMAGSRFGFSAALVSVSAVPSNSSHNNISSSALLKILWIISIWELLTCNKTPGMFQCDTPEEAIRSTIHLHIPLPQHKHVLAQSCWNSCAIYTTYSMKLLLSDVLAWLKPPDVRFNGLRKSDTQYLVVYIFFT